jgi:hypothetical protein
MKNFMLYGKVFGLNEIVVGRDERRVFELFFTVFSDPVQPDAFSCRISSNFDFLLATDKIFADFDI